MAKSSTVWIVILLVCLVAALAVVIFCCKDRADQKKKLGDCQKKIQASNSDLKTCKGHLQKYQKALSTCQETLGGNLQSCNDKLTSCRSDLDDARDVGKDYCASFAVLQNIKNLILEIAYVGNKGGPAVGSKVDPKNYYTPEYTKLSDLLEGVHSLQDLAAQKAAIKGALLACFGGAQKDMAQSFISALATSVTQTAPIYSCVQRLLSDFYQLQTKERLRYRLLSCLDGAVDMKKLAPKIAIIFQALTRQLVPSEDQGEVLNMIKSNTDEGIQGHNNFTDFLLLNVPLIISALASAIPIPQSGVGNIYRYFEGQNKNLYKGPYRDCGGTINSPETPEDEAQIILCVLNIWFCQDLESKCYLQSYKG